MKSKHLFLASAFGLGLALALLTLLNGPSPAHASPGTLRYVATTGTDDWSPLIPNDCTTSITPCLTVQRAVDAADPGDEVLVATGVYTDIRPRVGVTQVVYIEKTVTVRGGYSADFTARDPEADPTTLDAGGQGRVIYITGDVTPTLEGLSLTNGASSGRGGGVYAENAHPVIADCQIYSNTAGTMGWGGGVYIGGIQGCTNTLLIDNHIYNNTAGYGGGVYLRGCDAAAFNGNTVASNTAEHEGGGLYFDYGAYWLSASLTGNTITANKAKWGDGGGLYLYNDGSTSSFTLSGNTITSNTAACLGGGLYLYFGTVTLSGDAFTANNAERGGGLYLWARQATLTNTVVADNQASTVGSGLYIDGPTHLLHTTVARNSGGDGSGLCVVGGATAMTNTILVSHTIGITVTASNTATLEATLWGAGAWANEKDWDGEGAVITGTAEHNHRGNPAFVDPGGGDYHIAPNSAAIDQGLDAGVTTDLDGDPRPIGPLPDLGADEYVRRVYLPLVLR